MRMEKRQDRELKSAEGSDLLVERVRRVDGEMVLCFLFTLLLFAIALAQAVHRYARST